ncbi:MAG: phosphoribosylformylglycinamidine cyclo-ligase [Candidatus Pacebacteria bacterium]|nr:phosphoribosylformylglycinamidine cyclo-ligase [Candidatus Paceibacterota bacterium]MBP9715783.1 phosphoribosylformylglycinamidine cyclo-ligase [Candidatus Paceibacterota bacterium]
MIEKQDRYGARGVSSSKTEVHDAIAKLDRGIFPNAFCKILPDYFGSDEKYCNISHADGAGTKSSLAYAYWRETGDMSVWAGIAQDAFVMNLDDLLCVGLTDEPILYTQTIDRNKFLVPGEVISEIINATEELIQKMNDFGMNISFAGGETADVPDLSRTIIVNGTMTTRMKRDKILTPAIEPGAIIVGLSSFGMATYESEYNSGMGSNGLTSARHDIFNKAVGEKYPETFYLHDNPELIYCGEHNLTDRISINGWPLISMGKLVLSPTRTYAPVLSDLWRSILRIEIQGLIHCSGGGQTKIKRFLPSSVMAVKNDLFDNDFFSMIQKESGTAWKEMFTSFNMGHRFEVYCRSQAAARRVIKAANIFHVDAKIIGHCEERKPGDPAVRIETPHGVFDY